MPVNMPTASQLKAARAMLGYDQEQVSSCAGICSKTVGLVEAGAGSRCAYTSLVLAYVRMGFVFTSNDDFSHQAIALKVDPNFARPPGIPRHLLAP